MINHKIKEYILLTAVLVTVFGVYLNTMHPVFKNNDSPETTAAALTLGIGHPPAYPLYCMAGKILTLIPAGNYAYRMNVFASLLAILTLLVTYLILTRHIFKLFIPERSWVYWVLGLGSILILAFSRIFWNQAIEAKGGIYMLNLLFLAGIIYLSLELLQVSNFESRNKAQGLETKDSRPETKVKIRNLYLISFIFGLGLANHWPSMIILAPVFAYVFITRWQQLKIKGLAVCLVLLIAGVTPYIYLLVRANAGALFNWGDPKDLRGLLWVVFRQGYAAPVEASAQVFMYQAAEFLKLFFTCYSLFFLLAFAGAYAMYVRAKNLFWYLLSGFIMVVLMVVFYNRTKQGVIYLLDIFLMPAEYVCLIFMAAGTALFTGLFKNKKAVLYPATAGALALFSFMGYRHYEINDSGRDFLSYDFGRAILATMEPGSIYLADGDYNLMPVYYLQEIMKVRNDIVTATDSFLIFKWGEEDFAQKHGNIAMKPFDTANNEKNVIEHFIGNRNIYRSNYFPRFDNFALPYMQQQFGLLTKIVKSYEKPGARIFEMYSYRGIFDSFCVLNAANIDLAGWYAVSMVNQANALNQAGREAEAITLYKRALNFPNEKPEANICYNIALAYEKLHDFDNEFAYLKRALDKDGKLLAALERAGILCYENAQYEQAKVFFDRAILLGSSSEIVIKGRNILNSMTETQRLEAMLIKANEYIEKKDLKKATGIYDFLLEKHYKNAIIYRNIGVYHFRTGDYRTAIENFERSNNETPSSDAYLYTAYSYFKQNKSEKAIVELEAGLKQFPADKSLNDLYRQMKEQGKRNEKNTDSNNRQR